MSQGNQEFRHIQKNQKSTRWFDGLRKLFATSGRCHAIGSLSFATILAASLWVWGNPEFMLRDAAGDRQELVDAIRLLEDADDWRQKFVAYSDEADDLEKRVLAIKQWLPLSVNWERAEASIRSVAQETGNKVVSIRKADDHTGVRIGVVECECQLTGSYQSICGFVQQLSVGDAHQETSTSTMGSDELRMTYPMWCHHIRMQRIPVLIENRVQCAATLTIRIPFAAVGSASADIVKRESSGA